MIYAVTLSDFVRRYTDSRDLSPEYAANLCRRAAALETHCGEKSIGAVLTEANVNAMLASLSHLSPWTVRSYRVDYLSLWNAAADEGLVPYPNPRRIRRVSVPDPIVECFTLDEARQLIDGAKKLTGCYANGVRRAVYWEAAIRLAWDSGWRRGDVLNFERSRLRPDGTIRIVQHKSRKLVTVRLHPSTVEAIDRIDLPKPLEWTLDKSWFSRHFKGLARASGVRRGTFRWLRRASGSYVEAEHPGAGHRHLGHQSRAVFDRHYDARLGAERLPMPPEL